MVHHPMWVGYVRSCVALPGVFCDFRQIPLPDSGPAIADQMCGHTLRRIGVLLSSACGENHM